MLAAAVVTMKSFVSLVFFLFGCCFLLFADVVVDVVVDVACRLLICLLWLASIPVVVCCCYLLLLADVFVVCNDAVVCCFILFLLCLWQERISSLAFMN